MASAVVTIKLTPDELRTLRYALDETAKVLDESIRNMDPSDGRVLKAMRLKISELIPRL